MVTATQHMLIYTSRLFFGASHLPAEQISHYSGEFSASEVHFSEKETKRRCANRDSIPIDETEGNKSERASDIHRVKGTRKKEQEREWRERRDDNTLCLFALECIIPLYGLVHLM